MTTKRRTPPRATTVRAFVASASPERRRLIRAVRSLVREAAPDADESMRWGRLVYTHAGLLCYIDKARHHVSLGFFFGAHLRDPGGLLEGHGTRLRAVRLQSSDDLSAAVSRLVRAAVRHNEKNLRG
jgi:hypothetical protein